MARLLVIPLAVLVLGGTLPAAAEPPQTPEPLPIVVDPVKEMAVPNGPEDVVFPPGFEQPGRSEDEPQPKFPVAAFAGRTGAAKTRLLKANGGNADTERAVALGLAWLAREQKADGSWVFDGSDKTETAAATGFALLAFLGAGETQKDAVKYQKSVKAGVAWLVKNVPVNGANAGKFANSKTMYGQAIATLALVEAYGMTGDAALKPAAQAAVNYVVKAQAPNGSWGYAAGTNGDTSILGWQLQVLFAAKQAGLTVPAKSVKTALEFLDSVAAGEKKAVFGYTTNAGAAPGSSLTAIGLWSRATFDNWGPETGGLVAGAEGLLKRGVPKERLDLYQLHYATLVMKAAGGDAWQAWNEGPKDAEDVRKGGFRDVLVGAQIKKDDGSKGSWDPDTAFIGNCCGRVGTTALCVINLESYYRYSPVEKKPDLKK